MQYRKLMPWARKLTVLSALIATVYVSGAATPQEAVASSHVQYVPFRLGPQAQWHRWGRPVPADIPFLRQADMPRPPTSHDLQQLDHCQGPRAATPTSVPYSNGFKVVGCTAAVDARDNTATTFTNANKGVPIYWLNGNKVADDYEDFYDGSWDDEANDKNELGTNGPNTSQAANYPWTGCRDNGTESFPRLRFPNPSATPSRQPSSAGPTRLSLQQDPSPATGQSRPQPTTAPCTGFPRSLR